MNWSNIWTKDYIRFEEFWRSHWHSPSLMAFVFFFWCWRGELWISLLYWPSLNLLSSWVVIKYNTHVLKQSGIPKMIFTMLGIDIAEHQCLEINTFPPSNDWKTPGGLIKIAVGHLQVLIQNHGDVPEPRWFTERGGPVGKSLFGQDTSWFEILGDHIKHQVGFFFHLHIFGMFILKVREDQAIFRRLKHHV